MAEKVVSYLIPTDEDYRDAHQDASEELVYRKKISAVAEERDATNKLIYPWSFEIVQGFFRQDDEDTKDLEFNYSLESMGRKEEWSEIITKIKKLNDEADDNQSYKVLFLARHGQGYHNLCVSKYGLEQWDTHWNVLSTDGEIVWAPDPMLTDLGISQAKENHRLWETEIQKGAPIPSKFYVSPLQRSCHTLLYTWDQLKPESVHPIVTEILREKVTGNLCDKRSPRAVIKERFEKHGFVVGDNITEEDHFFDSQPKETLVDHAFRVNNFLQHLFDEDFDANKRVVDPQKRSESAFISTTSHAGTIRAFLTVLKHRHFTISTGGMIPVVVKATRRTD
ncbi:Piso0_002781 [Millerozyma farinosa CBS 7064]|uniref:Piso0_002781 protein n=1 Tax=Pichia sorbitophila (strain ATCC MYA-4447 / BCRC 22081 / CBS 7064 / NBRC 10061 / NRRL Y-12695) TaxID=559304 RepID=G8YDH7_PICSO|nr:Piso0_002781 [Millerozyma farinosa CBS 7064]